MASNSLQTNFYLNLWLEICSTSLTISIIFDIYCPTNRNSATVNIYIPILIQLQAQFDDPGPSLRRVNFCHAGIWLVLLDESECIKTDTAQNYALFLLTGLGLMFSLHYDKTSLIF